MQKTNSTPATTFFVGETVRVVYTYTGRTRETTVLHVGKRHIIVAWPHFASGQARFNLKPTFDCFNNDYIGATIRRTRPNAQRDFAETVQECLVRMEVDSKLTALDVLLIDAAVATGVGPNDCACQIIDNRKLAASLTARRSNRGLMRIPDLDYTPGFNEAHN